MKIFLANFLIFYFFAEQARLIAITKDRFSHQGQYSSPRTYNWANMKSLDKLHFFYQLIYKL